MIFLLDANVLIALTNPEHVHSERSDRWFTAAPRVAVSPVVEGALVRYMVRSGAAVASVRQLLLGLRDDTRFEFWPDDLSYADVDLGHVVGHRQVTDTYLAALAVHHGGRLATLDAALSRELPEATFLIPEHDGP